MYFYAKVTIQLRVEYRGLCHRWHGILSIWPSVKRKLTIFWMGEHLMKSPGGDK